VASTNFAYSLNDLELLGSSPEGLRQEAQDCYCYDPNIGDWP